MKQTQLFRDEEILLGDLCEIVIGKTPSRKNLDNFGENYIWVSIGDMNEKYIENSKEKLTAKGVKESHARLIPVGTLLLSFKLSLGKVAITKKPLYTNEAIVALIPKRRINVQYLYYYLKQVNLSAYARKAVKGLCLNKRILSKIKIKLAPIETQDKIVSILKNAEQLKQWREESDKLTDDYLNSVFLEMFGDPVKNPKKWRKKKLKEFGKIVTGNTPPRSKPEYYGNYIEWIKSDNINTPDVFLTRSQEMLSKKGREVGRIVPRGSVLVTCIAGSLSCIGNVAIADREVAFNQQINAIVPNEKIDEFFLYFLILNSKTYIQNYSTKAMKGMVSKSVFESIPLILPPPELQRKFGLLAKGFYQIKQYQKQSKQQIYDLFNVLMQKAFRGDLCC